MTPAFWQMLLSEQTQPQQMDSSSMMRLGNLREGIRSNKAGEEMARDRLSFLQQQAAQEQANKVQQLRWEAKQGIFDSAASGNENALQMWAGRARDLGLEVRPGSDQVEMAQMQGQLPPSMFDPNAPGSRAMSQPGTPQASVRPQTPSLAQTGADDMGRAVRSAEAGEAQAQPEMSEELPPEEPVERMDPDQMLEMMRGAQERGLQEQQKQDQAEQQAQAMVQRAQSTKDPAVQARALARAQAISPSPTRGLMLAQALEAQGNTEGAAGQYIEVASAQPTGNEMDDASIQAAQQKAQQMQAQADAKRAMPEGPASIGARPQQRSLVEGFTIVDPTTGAAEHISPRDMHALRQRKFNSMWKPIEDNAMFPELKQVAKNMQEMGHNIIGAGATPADAFKLTKDLYNKEADRLMKQKANEAAMWAASRSQGDKLWKEKWDRIDDYSNRVEMRHKIPQMRQALDKTKEARELVETGDWKQAAAVVSSIVRDAEGGRATDADRNFIMHNGSLWERAKGLITKSTTGQMTAEEKSALLGFLGMYQKHTMRSLNDVTMSAGKFFFDNAQNRELYGEQAPELHNQFVTRVMGDYAPKLPSVKRGGASGGAPATSSSSSESVRATGKGAAEQLQQIRGR